MYADILCTGNCEIYYYYYYYYFKASSLHLNVWTKLHVRGKRSTFFCSISIDEGRVTSSGEKTTKISVYNNVSCPYFLPTLYIFTRSKISYFMSRVIDFTIALKRFARSLRYRDRHDRATVTALNVYTQSCYKYHYLVGKPTHLFNALCVIYPHVEDAF